MIAISSYSNTVRSCFLSFPLSFLSPQSSHAAAAHSQLHLICMIVVVAPEAVSRSRRRRRMGKGVFCMSKPLIIRRRRPSESRSQHDIMKRAKKRRRKMRTAAGESFPAEARGESKVVASGRCCCLSCYPDSCICSFCGSLLLLLLLSANYTQRSPLLSSVSRCLCMCVCSVCV